eukprot:761250-Hanusia_phi.AAC.1
MEAILATRKKRASCSSNNDIKSLYVRASKTGCSSSKVPASATASRPRTGRRSCCIPTASSRTSTTPTRMTPIWTTCCRQACRDSTTPARGPRMKSDGKLETCRPG